MTICGGIESGGSKWECAIATGPADGRAATTIPTTTTDETLGRAVDFFLRAGPVAAIGIGSFGPVDTRADSKTWGFITTTPKSPSAHPCKAGRPRRTRPITPRRQVKRTD